MCLLQLLGPSGNKTCIYLWMCLLQLLGPSGNKTCIYLWMCLLQLLGPSGNKTCIYLWMCLLQLLGPSGNKTCIYLWMCLLQLLGPSGNKTYLYLWVCLLQLLGSSGFRAVSTRTPLHRAQENVHKRLYGQLGLTRDLTHISPVSFSTLYHRGEIRDMTQLHTKYKTKDMGLLLNYILSIK